MRSMYLLNSDSFFSVKICRQKSFILETILPNFTISFCASIKDNSPTGIVDEKYLRLNISSSSFFGGRIRITSFSILAINPTKMSVLNILKNKWKTASDQRVEDSASPSMISALKKVSLTKKSTNCKNG